MELSKVIKEHVRKELKDKLCLVGIEIAEPYVAPIIKPSPSPTKPSPSPTKPAPNPGEDPWAIPYPYPKTHPMPTPKG